MILTGPVAAPPHDFALVTGEGDPFLPHLTSHLALAERADIAVAFVIPESLKRRLQVP